MKQLILISILLGILFPIPNWFIGEKTIPEINELVSPSVVYILNIANNNGDIAGMGSGFIVRENGVIVTNYHVIENAYRITVQLLNKKKYEVTGIVDFDKELDYAIIKINASNLHPVSIGDSKKLEVGTNTIAIGNPEGLRNTVSDGIISGIRGNIGIIQTTAPITYGSSGGPLLNYYGEVIGVNSSGYDGSGALGFALPIHKLDILNNKELSVRLSMYEFNQLYGSSSSSTYSASTYSSSDDGVGLAMLLFCLWILWGLLPPG